MGEVEAARERARTPTPGWTTFQGDPQRTGRHPTAPAIESTPRIRWKAAVGIQGYLNGPLLMGKTVYVPSSGTLHNKPDPQDGLHALDLATGDVRWHAPALLDANGAVVAGDLVVFTADDGNVYAVERATGAERWRVGGGAAVYSTPLVLGDAVVVGNADGDVTARALDTGATQWQHRYRGAIRGGLASDGGRIFVVSQGGDVAALDPKGREQWRVEVTRTSFGGSGEEPIQGYNAPVVDRTRLIVPFARDTTYAEGPALVVFAIDSGIEVWRATKTSARVAGVDWANIRSSPAVAEGMIVWPEAYSNELAAIDSTTGAFEFRIEIGACYFPQYASPVVAGSMAYVPRHDGTLHAVDLRSRKAVWAFHLGDAAPAGPRPPGAAGTGSCQWDPPGFPLYAPPAIAADGTILVGSGEGYLYALEAAPIAPP